MRFPDVWKLVCGASDWFLGFGQRCPKSAFRRWLAQAQNRRSFWSALTKSRNDSKDGGYNEFKDMNAVV
jgi:hypothetical protein